MYTIIGAILGFVVGGGLAFLAFHANLDWIIANIGSVNYSEHALEHAKGEIVMFPGLPVFLLVGIIGLTIGTLVGARMDRRKEMIRRVLGVVYTISGAVFVTLALLLIILALPAIIFMGDNGIAEGPLPLLGIGIAALAVGAALCFAGRWVKRAKKQAERRQHE